VRSPRELLTLTLAWLSEGTGRPSQGSSSFSHQYFTFHEKKARHRNVRHRKPSVRAVTFDRADFTDFTDFTASRTKARETSVTRHQPRRTAYPILKIREEETLSSALHSRYGPRDQIITVAREIRETVSERGAGVRGEGEGAE